MNFDSVIVLGHSGYYPRFGFKSASRWNIYSDFEAPDEAFMAIELMPGYLNDKIGFVEFPNEYYDCM